MFPIQLAQKKVPEIVQIPHSDPADEIVLTKEVLRMMGVDLVDDKKGIKDKLNVGDALRRTDGQSPEHAVSEYDQVSDATRTGLLMSTLGLDVDILDFQGGHVIFWGDMARYPAATTVRAPQLVGGIFIDANGTAKKMSSENIEFNGVENLWCVAASGNLTSDEEHEALTNAAGFMVEALSKPQQATSTGETGQNMDGRIEHQPKAQAPDRGK